MILFSLQGYFILEAQLMFSSKHTAGLVFRCGCFTSVLPPALLPGQHVCSIRGNADQDLNDTVFDLS